MESIASQIDNLIKSGQDLTQDSVGVFTLNSNSLKCYEVNLDATKLSDNAKSKLKTKADSLVVEFSTLLKEGHSKYYGTNSNLKQLIELLVALSVSENLDTYYNNTDQYVREIALCNYFGISVTPSRLIDGVNKLSEVLESLATIDAIYSTLVPMTIMPTADGRLFILSYVHIHPKQATLVDSSFTELKFEEGCTVVKIEDII